MPRVNKVEKARKPIPHAGVNVGDTYYWWTFKTGPTSSRKVVSKSYPKPSQLTLSEFKSQWRGFSEEIAELAEDDGLYDALQEIAGRIRDLGSEQEDKLSNMPEGLQQGGTGELLQERADACSNWADEIEGLEQPEQEEPELQTFEEFLDGFSAPEPQRADFANEVEEYAEYLSGLQEWACEAWEEWKTECEDAREEKQEEFTQALSSLKEDAINADPGEV